MAFPNQFKAETLLRSAKERLDARKSQVQRSWIFWHLNEIDDAEYARDFPKSQAALDKKYPPETIKAEMAARMADIRREALLLGVNLPDLTGKTKVQLKELLS